MTDRGPPAGQPLKGILFDLGGTLFSYSGGRRMGGAVADVARQLGVDARPQEIGSAWKAANEVTMRRYARLDYFLHRDLFRDTLSVFAKGFGRPLPEELAMRFEAAQRQAVIEHLPLRDDCRPALQALKARGLYLAIVSNIDDDYLQPLVQRHGLDDLLDHWTSSEEARSCKPHTRIYRYALDKAGFDEGDALFVGDSLHHDVAGAAAAGIRSARIVEEGITTPLTSGLSATATPDFEISALTELIDIVDGLNAASG